MDHSIGLIDNWVVVPAAFGSLITGLFESWLTTCGFIKYRWVTVKWILTGAMIIYGPLVLSPWDRGIQAISKIEGILALQNPTYLSIISTFKPWMKKDRATAPPRRLSG